MSRTFCGAPGVVEDGPGRHLDEAGATARMIADQLGHSRVSMTRMCTWTGGAGSLAWRLHWRASIPWHQAKVWGNLWGEGQAQRHEAVFALVRELARGLEPLTCCLQDSCATGCATPAKPIRQSISPSRRTSGRCGWNRHHASAPACVCVVRAIRLAAPSTAF
jgi:hypothetical protein